MTDTPPVSPCQVAVQEPAKRLVASQTPVMPLTTVPSPTASSSTILLAAPVVVTHEGATPQPALVVLTNRLEATTFKGPSSSSELCASSQHASCVTTLQTVLPEELPQLLVCPKKKKRFYQKLFRFHGKEPQDARQMPGGEAKSRAPSPPGLSQSDEAEHKTPMDVSQTSSSKSKSKSSELSVSPPPASTDGHHQVDDIKRIIQRNWRALFHRPASPNAKPPSPKAEPAMPATGACREQALKGGGSEPDLASHSPHSSSQDSMDSEEGDVGLTALFRDAMAATPAMLVQTTVLVSCSAHEMPVVPPTTTPSTDKKKADEGAASSHKPFKSQYAFCRGSKILGRGGSGVVRLARGISGDTVYAVKEFRTRRRDEGSREYLKRLTAEFCISSLLHHPNIVETYDIVRDGSHWYEIMEFCPGGDLFSVIRDGHLMSEDVDVCFKQLLCGVEYLHSMGVAHRDLKPENLLIDAHGHLKITDFGVSEVFRVCWEKGPHMSKGVCGSLPYIAPEILSGGDYDAASADIWSCGIIYYAMTFHGIPWAMASPKDPNYRHYLKHRGVGFEPLVRLPHAAQVLLRCILEPDPKKRATIQDIMKDDWITQIQVPDHSFDALLLARRLALPASARKLGTH